MTPASITPAEFKRRWDAGEKLVLIDVRERDEWDICNLAPFGARLIPLGQNTVALRGGSSPILASSLNLSSQGSLALGGVAAVHWAPQAAGSLEPLGNSSMVESLYNACLSRVDAPRPALCRRSRLGRLAR